MTQEALKLALEALEYWDVHGKLHQPTEEAITAIKEALAKEKTLQALHSENERLGLYKDAYAEQEPVAWLLTDKNINALQVDSIQRVIDRLKHAHHTDLCVRINGQDEWVQADWLKHMVRVTQPQRTWVGLTANELSMIGDSMKTWNSFSITDVYFAIEAKLKEKNT